MTEIVKEWLLLGNINMENQLKKAIDILNKGGIIIFPTDTAFGVGCHINKPKSIKRLFNIRKRPITKSVPVLVDTVKMAQDYLYPISKNIVDKLIEPYWPGALTIVLPCKVEKISPLVRGGGDTMGVRIPNNKITRFLIRETAIPILGPSANFNGEPTPFLINEINPRLINLVDFIVDGECSLKQESTVIDCSVNPWTILRQGILKVNYE